MMTDSGKRELNLAWRYGAGKAVVQYETQIVGETETQQEPGYLVAIGGFRSCRWWTGPSDEATATTVEDLPVTLQNQVAGFLGRTMAVHAAVLDNGLTMYVESPQES